MTRAVTGVGAAFDPDAFREILRRATPPEAAHAVLGGVLSSGPVRLRVVEVEAYGGGPETAFPDPAAHTYRGPGVRNRVMFGDAGHLYVYLSHGIHHCTNIVFRPAGEGSGVLLRAAEVIDGHYEVALRRPGAVAGRVGDHRVARGPGNLGACLGVELDDGGTDLLSDSSPIRFRPNPVDGIGISSGPRVGVSRAADRPWRWWITGSPAVSAYRRSPRAPAVGEADAG